MSEDFESISKERHKKLVALMDNCPFCGEKNGDVRSIHFHHWVCACNKCDAQGPVCMAPESAVESWNGRKK